MNLRRIPPWMLVVLVAAVGLSTAATVAREAARKAGAASLAMVARALVCPTGAQEVLEFKPLPPESVSKLEETRPSRRRGAARVSPAPAAPEAPGAPAAPPAPISPEPGSTITLGKSGNIMRVGSDIHIESDQVVVGDVMAVGGDITVDGHVEGDVVAMGGDVYVHSGGRVDGDVVCMGGELHEDEGAVIGGQRVTASRHGRHARARRDDGGDGSGTSLAGPVVWLLITLGLAWAFAGLAPGRTGRALDMLKREPGVSAVTGVLAAMLTVPSIVALCLLVALLCITIIGIPLAIGALFGYFAFLGVLWVWGYVIGAAAVGDRIARRAAGRGAVPAAGAAPGAAGIPSPVPAGVVAPAPGAAGPAT
ncbi:MAG TPA: polymer-forming cytoskeletal protein, partial [Methylomirabilota bacterium]|nr:polymer-forming cytoskeletal protein [Methylomirabilota bacterium]